MKGAKARQILRHEALFLAERIAREQAVSTFERLIEAERNLRRLTMMGVPTSLGRGGLQNYLDVRQ